MQFTIHGSRFNLYKYFSLEFPNRRMQIGNDAREVMIRVAHHQHGSSFMRLA
jgi:hypothetical protein